MAGIQRVDARELAVRALLPGVALWGVIVGLGLLLTGPLAAFGKDEEAVNTALASDRTARWNSITVVWSHLGNTEIVIGVCVLVVALLWWRTREWRFAAVPAIAISLQATIFVLAANLVGRDRPPVPKLDPAPPTSSFPSGHVGASTALYAAFALLATRIERPWLRRVTIALCIAVPLLVTYARLYRGMHHPSDVAVGMLNGLVCAGLAWGWYLRVSRRRSVRAPRGHLVTGDKERAAGD